MGSATVQFLETVCERASKVVVAMDAPVPVRQGDSSSVPSRATGDSVGAAMLALCALVPACLAAARIGNVADAAHDAGVARVIGLDPQAWRSLDVAAGLVLAAVPLGTLATRTAMAGAVVMAASGAALYVITRRLLAACAEAPRLGCVVAAIATLSALTVPAWQLEAATAGGAVTGALLVFLPLVVLVYSADGGTANARWTAAAASLGLAAAQEPLVGVCALGGLAAFFVADQSSRYKGGWWVLAGCILGGAAPLILALARVRASGALLASALAQDWTGERGTSTSGSPLGFIHTQVGVVTSVLALVGAALAVLLPRARPLTAAFVAILVLGFSSAWVGAPVGPTRFGAPLLAAIAAACAMAAVTIQALARAVASARVPFARASAAIVVVLSLVFPVEGAEQTLAASVSRSQGAAAIWDDVVWGALPPRTVVLVADQRIYARALAARAVGSLRGDIAVLATVAPLAVARRALARDSALLPLWRDLEFTGAPTEESLSLLAAARPVAMAYEPGWGRAFARHMVPLTLFDRFAPEARGTSDRRRGLDRFAPSRERLAIAVGGGRERELEAAGRYLLGARASAMAANGERELVERAMDDARAFEGGP